MWQYQSTCYKSVNQDCNSPVSAMNSNDKPMTMQQYRALADFRYELRRFLRHSEQMTRRNGLTPLQYQLLLQIKSYSDPRSATIGALAERLQSKHHGVVALATRCEKSGLLVRQASKEDRRVVYLTLSAKGDRALERLARWHRDEHRSLKGRLVVYPTERPSDSELIRD
jgi:DNA-binding MarR family transcriptional regulator